MPLVYTYDIHDTAVITAVRSILLLVTPDMPYVVVVKLVEE